MTVSEWLDNKEAEGKDVSHIVMPDDLAHDEVPDETIYFKEIRTCSILCPRTIRFYRRTIRTLVLLQRPRQRECPHTTQPQWWISQRIKTWQLNS